MIAYRRRERRELRWTGAQHPATTPRAGGMNSAPTLQARTPPRRRQWSLREYGFVRSSRAPIAGRRSTVRTRDRARIQFEVVAGFSRQAAAPGDRDATRRAAADRPRSSSGSACGRRQFRRPRRDIEAASAHRAPPPSSAVGDQQEHRRVLRGPRRSRILEHAQATRCPSRGTSAIVTWSGEPTDR